MGMGEAAATVATAFVDFHQKKVYNRTAIGSNHPNAGYRPERRESRVLERCLHIHGECSVTDTQQPTGGRSPRAHQGMEGKIQRGLSVYTVEYDSATAGNDVLAQAATCTKPEPPMMSEISRPHKDEACVSPRTALQGPNARS